MEPFEGYMEGVPDLPKWAEKWVRDNSLKNSKYMWCKKDKEGNRWGYCSHCDKLQQLTGPRRFITPEDEENGQTGHNKWGFCPACKSKVQFKDEWRGHSYLMDYGKAVFAIRQGKAVWIRFFDVTRDYRKTTRNVQTLFTEEYRAYLNPDTQKTEMWKRGTADRWAWPGDWHLQFTDKWYKMKTVDSRYNNYHFAVYPRGLKGTKFQYADIKSRWNPIRYMDIFARYPAIEYLEKNGFKDIVDNYINHQAPKLNWRGKSPQKVFGLNTNEIKMLKRLGGKSDRVTAYKMLKKIIPDLTPERFERRYKSIGCYEIQYSFERIIKHAPAEKALQYISRQEKEMPVGKYAMQDYADYLQQCVQLKINLKKECNLFPKNLLEAHDRTNELIGAQRQAEIEKQDAEKYKKFEPVFNKIETRYKKLCEQYYFEQDGLFIRPAASREEIVKEGISQQCCVGGAWYSEKHGNGVSYIMFVRQTAAPDKSFYTVEMTNTGTIVQVRGYKNCGQTEEVKAFLEAFKDVKVFKTKEQKENKKSA